MAGKNIIFKEGQIVFKQGDPADSMYLVRKGTLLVYIAQEDGELHLATLEPGAIVGEMAFFDQKPRSASVRAPETCEVTCITKADFDKLLQQVPKWMVTMMQSLSGRLRTTNEKVQKLEAAQLSATGGPILPNQRYPFQIVHKTLRVLALALAKDGEKDGREHVVATANVMDLWREMVAEDDDLLKKILRKLQAFGLIEIKKSSMNQSVIAFTNRGGYFQLTDFIARTVPKFPASQPFFSSESLALFEACVETAANSGYDSFNVNITEVIANHKARGEDTSQWAGGLSDLIKRLDLKVSKNGNQVLLKIVTKEHGPALKSLQYLNELKSENLI